MKENLPFVSCIVVNYNGKKYLNRFFCSFKKTNYTQNRMEMVFVDNGSRDGSIDFVKKRSPAAKIIKNVVNNYCKAINLGINESKGEFVALLNNDVELEREWLTELIRVIVKDEKIAAVGSKLLDRTGKIQNAGHLGLPNFYWGERGAGREAEFFYDQEEMPSLCGAAVVYRKSALVKVGLFDEDFIMFGEDTEIALRLRKAGFKLVFVPTSIVYHHFHGTASDEQARFYIERNRLLTIAKHYPYKLSNALFGSGYFTAFKETKFAGKIYSIVPEALIKLMEHNSFEDIKFILPEILEELKNITNKECDLLSERINKVEKSFENKSKDYTKLLKNYSDLNSTKNQLDIELKRHKNGLESLSQHLRNRIDELQRREKELESSMAENERLKVEWAETSEQIKDMTDENGRLKGTLESKEKILKENDEALKSASETIGRIKEEYRKMTSEIALQAEQLAQQEKDLSEKGMAIGKYKVELESLNQLLQERMEEILLKDGHLAEKEAEIAKIEELIKGEESEIIRYKEELENLSQQLRFKMDEILTKEQQSMEAEVQINSYKEELTNLSVQLQERMNELSFKDGQLAEKSGEMSQKDELISEKEKEIARYKEELENLARQLRSRMEEILLKDGQLTENATEISQKDAQLKEREVAVTRFKNEMEGLSQQLLTRMNEALLKDGQLAEKEDELARLKERIKNLSQQLLAQIDETSAKEEQNARYKEELENFTGQLRSRMDEVLSKETEISRRDEAISALRKELNGIYNSEGYKFVLRPLWDFLWNARHFLKLGRSRLGKLIWSALAFFLSPSFLVLSFFFLAENIFSKLFVPLFKLRKRRALSYQDLKVSLVMPNWNGLEILKITLPSIFQAEGFKNGENEVLIVDDGSTDGSMEFIKSNYPQIHLLRNRRNMGFGYTCNRGVREAQNELIVLINNDIIVTENFLPPLIEHLKDEDVFAISPKLYGWDRQTFAWGMHMGHFKEGHIRLWNEADTKNEKHLLKVAPSIFAIGGAMVFRKQDFIWLGGFDKVFRPNCWEDIDLSYRAWKRGLKVLYEPQSVMYHKGKATLTYERHKEVKNELMFTWKNITDTKILKEHLYLLPWNLYKYRFPFLKGYLWAWRYLPISLIHRIKDRGYNCSTDKKIFDRCMRYYRNFLHNGLKEREAAERKTVLWITPFMPYPLNAGGKIRMYTLAKLIKDRYNLILLTLIHHEDQMRFIPELEKIFMKVYAIHPKSPIKSLFFPSRYRYSYSELLKAKLDEIQKIYPLDIVQIESNELLYLIDSIKHVPVVYTEHDASIMSFYGSFYQKKDRGFLGNFFDYLKKVYFHDKSYNGLERVIALSRKDAYRLCTFFTNTIFSLIPTGVDIRHFVFKERIPATKDLIFVGHYPHFPNEDAVLYFAERILPLLRREMPEVRFLVVGSEPTSKVRGLARTEGVEFVGEVEDVSSWLERAAIFVNPVRFSAGIKGKVLEPMSMGIPVVSTPQGLSGIEAREGKEVLVGKTPKEFAEKVLLLLRDQDLYRKLALNARKMVEAQYDWEAISLRLDRVYKGLTYDPMVRSEIEIREAAREMTRIPEIINKVNNTVGEAIRHASIESSGQGGPEELHIELTYNCNSRCIMCDLWDYHKRNPNKGAELTRDEIEHFVRGSRFLENVKTVVLSGGEPFLRKDIVDICGFFSGHLSEASIGILTNAVDTEAVIAKSKEILDKYRPKSLWLGSSLDGIGSVHDRIRGHEGAFENLRNTLKGVKRELPSVDFSVTMTLTPYNYEQLIPVKEFSKNEGINFFAQFVVPKEARGQFIWRGDQLRAIERDTYKIISDSLGKREPEAFLNSLEVGQIDIDLFTKLFYWSNLVKFQKRPRRVFPNCVAGSRFAMFDPYGNLFFCPILKESVVGSIRQNGFDGLWTSEEANRIRDFISKGTCSCWLVCIVFPMVSAALVSTSGGIEGDIERHAVEIDISEEGGRGEVRPEENLILNDSEYSSRKIILKSTPRGIGIGAHYGCNANCIFCLQGEHQNFDLNIYNNFFRKELQPVLPQAEYLNLCGFGELLLMPKVEGFLEALNAQLPQVNKIITTNGIPLTPPLTNKIIRHRYVIQISLHASNPQLHRQLTRTSNFDEILNQIRYIATHRSDNSMPHLVLISILNTLNIEDLPNLVRLASDLGVDEMICNYMTAYTKAHLKLSCFFKQESTNEKFNEAETLAEKLQLTLRLPPGFGNGGNWVGREEICSEPWRYVYVETEGSVLPCCFAGNHIGYLNKERFEDIWNGTSYQELRQALIERKPGNWWCRYCYKYNPELINDIRSHVSLRPDLQREILDGLNFNR